MPIAQAVQDSGGFQAFRPKFLANGKGLLQVFPGLVPGKTVSHGATQTIKAMGQIFSVWSYLSKNGKGLLIEFLRVFRLPALRAYVAQPIQISGQFEAQRRQLLMECQGLAKVICRFIQLTAL